MKRRALLAVVLGMLVALFVALRTEPSDPVPKPPPAVDLQTILDREVEISFVDKRLEDVLAEWSTQHGFAFRMDETALYADGLDGDTLVSLRTKGPVTLRAALEQMLPPDARCLVQDDEVLITTYKEQPLVTQVHFVGDLAGGSDEVVDIVRANFSDDFGFGPWGLGVVLAIPMATDPADWGSEPSTAALMVTSTRWMQATMASLIEGLRRIQNRETDRPWQVGGSNDPQDVPHRFARALTRPVDFTAREMTLAEFAAWLGDTVQIPVWIDEKSLEDEGVSHRAIRLNAAYRNVPVRRVLRQMLDPLGLEVISKNDLLVLTTQIVAEEGVFTRLYPVFMFPPGYSEDLCDTITSVIAPYSWDEGTGPGPIRYHSGGCLAIPQSEHVHRQIEGLLDVLAELERRKQDDLRPRTADWTLAEERAVRELELALDAPRDFALNNVPLPVAVERLAATLKTNCFLDATSLLDEGIEPATRVSLAVQGISTREALARVLWPLDLTWIVAPDGIEVTTQIKADEHLLTRVYRLPLLLRPSVRRQYADDDELEDLCQLAIEPKSWDTLGGRGSVWQFGDQVLIVSQTYHRQRQVERLLTSLFQRYDPAWVAEHPGATSAPILADGQPQSLRVACYALWPHAQPHHVHAFADSWLAQQRPERTTSVSYHLFPQMMVVVGDAETHRHLAPVFAADSPLRQAAAWLSIEQNKQTISQVQTLAAREPAVDWYLQTLRRRNPAAPSARSPSETRVQP